MDKKRFERILELFREAGELPEAERVDFLNSAGDDEEMRGEVLAMLEADARGDSPLDGDVGDVAEELFGDISIDSFPAGAFAPYRLIEKIGEGGMGVVFLAERADLQSQVAIKVLPFARCSPDMRERFVREQRTLANLNHPFIARLYHAGILPDGTPWFAMEHVKGVEITDYCEGRSTEGVPARFLSIEERLTLFSSACEAVRYSHGKFVIHRDIKPSNILVTADGTPKLLDFGIAKQLSALEDGDGAPGPAGFGDDAQPRAPAAAGKMTKTLLGVMTPAYAAPEQFRGMADARADVYALGVTLYELLSGQYPFRLSECSTAEVERIVTETDPPKPSVAARRGGAPDAPPRNPRAGSWAELDVLCGKAMHKDREQRYGSVEALIRDVNHFLHCEPLETPPVPLGYKLGKFVKRRRAAVAAAAVVLAVIVGLVTFFTVRLTIARNEALAAAARRERIQRFMLNLFAGGDKQAGPTQDLRVVDIIDRGAQEAQSLQNEPEVQAELWHTLGVSYQNLGHVDRAETHLSNALEKRKALYGPEHAEVARSLVALGHLRIDQARLDEAEQLIREGLEKTRRLDPPDDVAAAGAITALGRLLNARGSYGEAIRVLEEGVKLHRDPSTPTTEFASSLNQLANAHYYAGNYDASDELNRRVLDINRRLFGERHILVADDLTNLANIQHQRSNYKEAEELYNQALAIVRGWYRSDHPAVASKLILLSQPFVAQKRYDEAEKLLLQALEINERVYSKTHPRVALALNELGVLAIHHGRLDDAEARLLRVAEINRAIYGDDHTRTITAMSNLASVYSRRKEYARAEKLLREVVERYAKISPTHLNTGIAHLKLGFALMNQRLYGEAETHTLAGYEIASKQKSVSWLNEARKDLVTLYDAMGQPEKAAKIRAEMGKE